mmetsp:Transcript_23837/g.35435  ORF Transcript_23837/g.35435 Transcript_23837/m.35435 type:complete len:1035 (+) Transcript_23837:104-3208(+)
MKLSLNEYKPSYTMSKHPERLSRLRKVVGYKRPSRRFVASTTILLFVYIVCSVNYTSSTLENIRRILCLADDGNSPARASPYIHGSQVQRNIEGRSAVSAEDVVQRMNPPMIPARRPTPSHIELCQAFLQRRDAHLAGETIEGHVHVSEDQAVCLDWSTPYVSLMEMFAGFVINQVSQKYGVTYSHDCHRSPVPNTGDGLDWTTAQQEFPPSGLVLDDGSVTEEDVVALCKGCLGTFNLEVATASVTTNNPNPSWFQPHATRHCIMYPGTTRPIINSEDEVDLAAVQQQRRRAQDAPLGKLYKTIQDRMRLSAAKHKLEHESDLISRSGRFIEDEEEEDGVVIILDDSTMPMSKIQVGKNIPPSVKVISIIVTPICVTAEWEDDQTCIDYANFLQETLQDLHPDAEVGIEITTSSAAATSRMVRARSLVCGPGTTNCLIPAMSKEENTFAVMGESTARSFTDRYFDFLSTNEYSIQIANIDNDSVSSAGSMGRGSFSEDSMGRSSHLTPDQLSQGLAAFGDDRQPGGKKAQADYVDGCVELRGRIGDWEQDFVYEDLATDKNELLRGSSIEDLVTDIEEGQRTRGSGSMDGRTRSFSDSSPDCGLDMLNIHGLCEVVSAMQLGVIQFVGDKYTEEMVRSFWALLGIDDGDSGEVPNSTTDPKMYRKTVHCPKEKMSFDIVFTPNEKLQDIDEPPKAIGSRERQRYVPAPAPVAAPVGVDFGRGVHTGPGVGVGQAVGVGGVRGVGYGGVGYGGYGYGYGRGGGSCWTDPYGAGCGCNPASMTRSVAPPPPPPMPQYNPACQCIPFQQQYQYNYAAAAQPYNAVPVSGRSALSQPGQVLPGTPLPDPYLSGRQIIVGGVTPNQPLPGYVEAVDNFGRTITNTVDQNDIVVLRTGAVVPEAYGGTRRTQQGSDIMTEEEIDQANKYLHRSVDEFRRRTRQSDILSYDPNKSKMPFVHILDVSHMTNAHPLSKAGPEGRRDLKSVPNLYDHWNHLLYTNMRDMAAAELARNSESFKSKQQEAPPGSPYENSPPWINP